MPVKILAQTKIIQLLLVDTILIELTPVTHMFWLLASFFGITLIPFQASGIPQSYELVEGHQIPEKEYIVDSEQDHILQDNLCTFREALIANNEGKAMYGCQDPKGVITFSPDLYGKIILLENEGLPKVRRDLTINGPGSELLEVNGNDQFRVFDIGFRVNVIFSGISITHGKAPKEGYSSGDHFFKSGGGIRAAAESSVTIVNVVLHQNTALMGGGIYAHRLTVLDSILSNNRANFAGGGISASQVTVTDTEFLYNRAILGGGLDNHNSDDVARINGSRFYCNQARNGGAIHHSNGSLEVIDSEIISNRAKYDGGGINSASKTVVMDSLIEGNLATKGGAIFYIGSFTIMDSTILNNHAYEVGAYRWQNMNELRKYNRVVEVNNVMRNNTMINEK